jgi:hypothetical protein
LLTQPAADLELRAPLPRRALLAITLIAALGYLVTFSAAGDGMLVGNDALPYAHLLASGASEGWWNTHHLAFHPLSGGLAHLVAAVEGGAVSTLDVLRAQRLVAALGGGICVALLARLASRFLSRPGAVATAAVFAFTTSQWLYASSGETQVPANAAMAGLWIAALEQRLGVRATGRRGVLVLAAWLLAAVLLRQDSVLAIVPLALLAPARRWVPATALAGLVAMGLWVAAWSASGTEHGLVDWTRGIQGSGLWGQWPGPAAYVTERLPVTLAVIGLAFAYTLLAAPLLGWATVLFAGVVLAPRARPSRPAARIALALVLGAASRWLFYAWWQAGNTEFHASTVLLLLMAAVVLQRPAVVSPVRTLLTFALAHLLFLGNGRAVVAPFQGEWIGERARTALSAAGEDGMVVALDTWQVYALQREDPVGIELVDASELAPRPAPRGDAELDERALALRSAIDAARAAGRTVVVARDTLIPVGFHTSPWPIGGAADLIPPDAGHALTDDGPGEGPFGWVLPPTADAPR